MHAWIMYPRSLLCTSSGGTVTLQPISWGYKWTRSCTCCTHIQSVEESPLEIKFWESISRTKLIMPVWFSAFPSHPKLTTITHG
jgi:hypothetical protein